jgi:6-pyruvoyltetrahydropterin/6-carboxytetrahydropterin synthase
VTVSGYPDPETGFVMNLKDLSDLVKEKVIDALDHKNLNLDVPFLTGVMASTENIVIAIWERLEAPIRAHGGELCKLKLIETENNFVTYYG